MLTSQDLPSSPSPCPLPRHAPHVYPPYVASQTLGATLSGTPLDPPEGSCSYFLRRPLLHQLLGEEYYIECPDFCTGSFSSDVLEQPAQNHRRLER
jgi:hypothetical protein